VALLVNGVNHDPRLSREFVLAIRAPQRPRHECLVIRHGSTPSRWLAAPILILRPEPPNIPRRARGWRLRLLSGLGGLGYRDGVAALTGACRGLSGRGRAKLSTKKGRVMEKTWPPMWCMPDHPISGRGDNGDRQPDLGITIRPPRAAAVPHSTKCCGAHTFYSHRSRVRSLLGELTPCKGTGQIAALSLKMCGYSERG
jgi:hypothetical protein